MLEACARAMTSEGPVRQAGSDTPGTSCSAAVTAAALPTLVWIKMYAAITGLAEPSPAIQHPPPMKETVQSKSRPGVLLVGDTPSRITCVRLRLWIHLVMWPSVCGHVQAASAVAGPGAARLPQLLTGTVGSAGHTGQLHAAPTEKIRGTADRPPPGATPPRWAGPSTQPATSSPGPRGGVY